MMNTRIESYLTCSLLTMTQDVPLQKNFVLQLIPKFKIVSTVSLHLFCWYLFTFFQILISETFLTTFHHIYFLLVYITLSHRIASFHIHKISSCFNQYLTKKVKQNLQDRQRPFLCKKILTDSGMAAIFNTAEVFKNFKSP